MYQSSSYNKFSENNQKNLPQIRQTLFIVDPTRQYLFDVNQNITINKLKRMIVAAAELNKVGLRIFHDGVEYTNYGDSCLDQLFPDLQRVEFHLQFKYDQVEDLEEIIDLKLKQYCDIHNGKYPYFYCFTCGKSICSDCLRSGVHNNHDTKEKYDYLQESRNLVELLFKDLKDILKNAKGVNNESIEDLKGKVSIQFFPKLIEMVKQIENNMLNLILFFLEKEKDNFKTIENNVNLLKNHCKEGLDKLKQEIVIEDMMINEDVFLTFDSKFKEIGKEKEKFKEDIEKYKRFSENLNLIQNIIEKTYNEIYEFLLKYLDITEFENIKLKINEQNIGVIDKNEIFKKLLSNVKKRPGSELKDDNNKVNSNTCFLRSRNVPPAQTKEFNVDEGPKKRVNFLLTSTQKNNKSRNALNDDNNGNLTNNLPNYNNEYKNNNNLNNNYKEFDDKNRNISSGLNIVGTPNDNINQNQNIDNFLKDQNPNNLTSFNSSSYNYNNPSYIQTQNINTENSGRKQTNEKYEEMEDDREEKGPIYTVVCNIIPSSDQIVLYNVDLDTIMRRKIEFSYTHGTTHFLDECAWVNFNNKVYILGGMNDFNQSTKIFLEYDPIKNIIRRLPDSINTHSRHSLFAYNNEIFVVGGDGLECEKYNIINNEWSNLPNLEFKQIYPVLYVHNNILYSFFGIDENTKKTDNAQKLNISNKRGKWVRLTYNRNGCNLCVYGCGIAKTGETCILFLGGMDDNGIRNDAIQFDFSNLTASKTNYVLEEKAYFKDSFLLRLSPKNYGNFSIDNRHPFLKIQFCLGEK